MGSLTSRTGRVIRYERFGDPGDVLRIHEEPVPEPGSGELLVRMIARPINPSDIIPIGGAYAHRIGLPAVPGYEGAGVVESVGRGVAPELVGTCVLPLRGGGTWQDYVVAPADWAVPVPADLQIRDACQLYINPLSAWAICTDVLRLSPGDTLLVNAGGSALGRILAQLSRLLGFRLIAVVRRREHRDRLEALGAWHVHVDGEAGPDVRQTVRALTDGAGASASVDCVGGRSGLELIASTRGGGTALSAGLLSGQFANGAALAQRSGVELRLFHLRHWQAAASADEWRRAFGTLIGLVRAQRLRLSEIEGEYALQDVRQAIAASRQAKRGKILLI